MKNSKAIDTGTAYGLTRRKFLQGALATTAAAAATSVGLASCAPAAETASNQSGGGRDASDGQGAAVQSQSSTGGTLYTNYENPDNIGIVQDGASEEECDFVVVGTGVGGLTAAMVAAEQMPEARIIVLEKLSMVGGNGNFAEINAPGHQVTYEEARAAALEKVRASTNLKDLDLLASLAYDTGKNSAWLFNKHGIAHDDTNMYYETRNGSKAMKQLADEINSGGAYANVEIRTNARATALLTEDEYTCVGVQVKEGSKYSNIKAKAVFLATGGLATNLDLLAYYTNQDVVEKCIGIGAGQDGDGHLMVEHTAHGMCKSAYPTGMFHNVKGFEFTSPLGVAVALQPTNLLVNQFGNRYDSEERLNTAYPFIAAGKAIETAGKCFSILGQNSIKHFEETGSETGWWYYYHVPTSLQEDLKRYESNEYVFKADTLEELAKMMGIPEDSFMETVTTYEADAKAGTGDSAFGKSAEYMVSLGEGPYYGFRIFSGVCQTNGGIRVDELCRVCDPYFVPIEGLYAGGISVSGLNVEVYSPGTSQAAGLWSGSLVARHVVEEVLGGTVADDWFGDKPYDGPLPNREGKDPNKPLAGEEPQS